MIQVQFYVGSRYRVDREKLRQTVVRVLNDNNISHAQVDVSIVGSRKIKHLNESELQHSGSTDVLSFPQHEKKELEDFPLPKEIPPHLGDVIISYPEAVASARKYGKLVDDRICFYLEHGLMHLLGYHHD